MTHAGRGLAFLFALTTASVGFSGEPPASSAPASAATEATVETTDGSRLVGTVVGARWQIKTSASETLINLDAIESVSFDRDTRASQVVLKNGDRLSGSLQVKSIVVKTSFATVKVPLGSVQRISFGPSEAIEKGGEDPLPLGFQQYFKCTVEGDAAPLGDTGTAKACLRECKSHNAAGCWWLDGTGGHPRTCNMCRSAAPARAVWANDWGIALTGTRR